ncbi:MAG: SGNH/GDSL hydrolase family protein [Candidatus Thiodiazotropha lotti]|nr:SGNH/GDSL hydrolase family protein [Candidatus Thiodiazotropha lotti]
MKQILLYADSLSWGIIPGTRGRFNFNQRWPGVLELELLRRGNQVRIIEDCLNGRRTVFEDPFKAGRNGLLGLEQRIEINSPLSLVMLFLGTNDFQSMHNHSAWHAAQGINSLIMAIRKAPIEPGMPHPKVLVIAPPTIQVPKGEIAAKFEGAERKAVGLAAAIEHVASENGCAFFDAGLITNTSRVDGVHLDLEQHQSLGHALADTVQRLVV